MRSFIFFYCLIIALPCAARDVYKWTSEDGETIYSDIYHRDAEQISVSKHRTRQTQSEQPSGGSEQTAASTGMYQTFEVAQPSNDATIRSDEGIVEVGLSLSPLLVQGHVIQVYVDGNKLNTDLTSTQFKLNELNRGTHSLQAKVVDAEGKPQIATPTVSFHLRQSAVTNP